MRFSLLTLFPGAFESYLKASIIKRAEVKRLIRVEIIDIRKFAKDRHKTADDKPYGGGPGMVLKIEPLVRALASLKLSAPGGKNKKLKVIVLSASGKQFNAKMASDLAKQCSHIILIAGHYEGIDARIKPVLQAIGYKSQEISVGPYVLTGGELPAMVILDAVSRHIPEVLGKMASLEEKRHGVGIPVYTRPKVFRYQKRSYRVPKVLLSGDHKKIEEWRGKHRK